MRRDSEGVHGGEPSLPVVSLSSGRRAPMSRCPTTARRCSRCSATGSACAPRRTAAARRASAGAAPCWSTAAPGRLRDPGPAGGGPGRHDPRRPARRRSGSGGPRRSRPPGPASAASAPRDHRPSGRPGGRRGGGAAAVERALLAHLCRCTGWRTIVEAATTPPRRMADRDLAAAARRAEHRGGHAPAGRHARWRSATAASPTTWPRRRAGGGARRPGGWAVGETLLGPGRRRQGPGPAQRDRVRHPLDLPPGDWDVTLRTTWVEPAYVEPDASWCRPGRSPAAPLANGGAFGGKLDSPAPGGGPAAGRPARPARPGPAVTGGRRAPRPQAPADRGRGCAGTAPASSGSPAPRGSRRIASTHPRLRSSRSRRRRPAEPRPRSGRGLGRGRGAAGRPRRWWCRRARTGRGSCRRRRGLGCRIR